MTMELQASWIETVPDARVGDWFSDNWQLKFVGPGVYRAKSNGDFMIVIPNRPDDDANIENIWNIDQPKGTIYEVHVFNVPWEKSIFHAIDFMPTRT